MKKFEEKKFNILELKEISQQNITEHLKLYAGYVNNTNLILEKINELSENTEANMLLLGGLQKRFSFEYNGMRNHEVYFNSLSGGFHEISSDSMLKKMIFDQWGSFEKWLEIFKSLATTRGVGWAMLYFDQKENRLINAWVDEQHLGQLQECTLILALDMWEHSFVSDFQPSGKKQYIEAFFANLNWKAVEANLAKATN